MLTSRVCSIACFYPSGVVIADVALFGKRIICDETGLTSWYVAVGVFKRAGFAVKLGACGTYTWALGRCRRACRRTM